MAATDAKAVAGKFHGLDQGRTRTRGAAHGGTVRLAPKTQKAAR